MSSIEDKLHPRIGGGFLLGEGCDRLGKTLIMFS